MSQPERYEPRARSVGGAWKMVKCKDGAYVCFEQHEEIVAALAAENERLRKACELVFGEAAKRKFLRCYPGNDFYVSLEAMEEMKNALGWNAAKEGRDAK